MKTLIVITDTAKAKVDCETFHYADGHVIARVKDEVVAAFQFVYAAWFDGTASLAPHPTPLPSQAWVERWQKMQEVTSQSAEQLPEK